MSSPESKSNRNYKREAEEYNYKVGHTRISEFKKTGTLEEISIAATLNKGSLPTGMGVQELKELIARAASPKASPENVQIAFSNKIKPYLSQERPVQPPPPEESGNPWWTGLAVLGGVLFISLIFISGRSKESEKKQKKEITSIVELAKKQEKAIEEANQRTLQLHQIQQQMYQQISTGQVQAMPQQDTMQTTAQSANEFDADIAENIDEEELATTLKSWIESSD